MSLPGADFSPYVRAKARVTPILQHSIACGHAPARWLEHPALEGRPASASGQCQWPVSVASVSGQCQWAVSVGSVSGQCQGQVSATIDDRCSGSTAGLMILARSFHVLRITDHGLRITNLSGATS
jgi:hypothetical protein